MKKLSKLKLNALSEANLLDREMNVLRGGDRVCGCSCYYANSGGSSSGDNRTANHGLGNDGGYSTSGCNQYVQDDYGYDSCSICDESFTPFTEAV
jgi:natural product precursor